MGSVAYLTLKETEPEDFFKVFNLYFTRSVNENKPKITLIEQSLNTKYQKLASLSNLAVKDLEPLLLKIEKELKDNKLEDLKRVNDYKDAKKGDLTIHGENLASTLYHAIRLTLEQHYQTLGFKHYENVLTKHESGFVYFDYYKVIKIYPSYKKFVAYQGWLEKFLKESPEGGFQTLYGLYTGFQKADKETIEFFVRKQALKGFTLLNTYLESNLDLKELRRPYMLKKRSEPSQSSSENLKYKNSEANWYKVCDLYIEPRLLQIRYKNSSAYSLPNTDPIKFLFAVLGSNAPVSYIDVYSKIYPKQGLQDDANVMDFAGDVHKIKTRLKNTLKTSKLPDETIKYVDSLIEPKRSFGYSLKPCN